MDFLILYCALKLLDVAIPILRLLFASFLSALGAVLLLDFYFTQAIFMILKLLLFLCMTILVVPPQKLRLYLRFSLVVFILSALCGGLSLCVLFGKQATFYTDHGQMLMFHLPAYLWPLSACVLLLLVLWIKEWIVNVRLSSNLAQVTIRVKGREFRCRGYFDTGHLQNDPVTGKSIIVVSAQVFSGWIECEPHFCAMTFLSHAQELGMENRVCLLSVQTVSGDGLLAAFRADHVYVCDREVLALIALVPHKLDEKARFEALLPMNLKKKV